jgi:Rv2525c-like, glycoside hydrolase-like domain
MPFVSRRTFSTGLLASALAPARAVFAQPNDPASIAIIDTPHNAARMASQLAAQNVKVIVRFFARKPQPGLREKVMAADANIIDGIREPTLLIRHGLSIVSLYQYRNNLPEKFLRGLEDTGSAKAEAVADAKAALDQARLVGQPEGSAVYFGIDFNVTRATAEPVLEYFRVMNGTVGNHYAIGIYGNGFVNRTLRQEKLAVYNWISASRAHEQTVDFYNSGHWHLFQNQVDRRWFGPPGKCSTGLDVDTNLQNPNAAGIGAWGAGEVDSSRNQKIFDQRRFAIRETAVVQGNDGNGRGCKSDTRVPRNANIRILAQSGAWSDVDTDEDGNADGRVRTADLTSNLATMPPWRS